MTKFRPRPDRLPGAFENRVFVGGQYDFMPTLKWIAQYVREIGPPLVGRRFEAIIPYDYDIREEQTMDWDLAILGQCRYAIFDMSDLGAQLVEMQEAKQKQTMISSLVVYPVRDKNRRHEPERGKRTIYSFGLPYFGYVELEELKDVIARFLHGGPRSGEWPTRHVTDPELEKCLRIVKLLRGKDEFGKAWEYVTDKCSSGVLSIELWLEKAFIGTQQASPSDLKEVENAWEEARKLSSPLCPDCDQAEFLYYQGLVKEKESRIATDRDNKSEATRLLTEAANLMKRAGQLTPGDARFPFLEAYWRWELADNNKSVDKKVLTEAIQLTQKALTKEIHDPLMEINARNNLAYFYCALADKEKTNKTQRVEHITKALEYSEGLPSYHRLFRRMHGYWLDTRAWALSLRAEDIIQGKAEGDIDTLIDSIAEAGQLFRHALELERGDHGIVERAQKTQELKKEAATWLRVKAEEYFAGAQTSLHSDPLHVAQVLSAAADEFDPLLDSRRVESNLQSEKGLSLLVELRQLLDGMTSEDEREDFARKIAEAIKEHREHNKEASS